MDSLRAGDDLELLLLLFSVTAVIHAFVVISLQCLLVNPTAFNGDGTCPFDGYFTDVALRLLLLLFLYCRFGHCCIAVKHLLGINELNP